MGYGKIKNSNKGPWEIYGKEHWMLIDYLTYELFEYKVLHLQNGIIDPPMVMVVG